MGSQLSSIETENLNQNLKNLGLSDDAIQDYQHYLKSKEEHVDLGRRSFDPALLAVHKISAEISR